METDYVITFGNNEKWYEEHFKRNYSIYFADGIIYIRKNNKEVGIVENIDVDPSRGEFAASATHHVSTRFKIRLLDSGDFLINYSTIHIPPNLIGKSIDTGSFVVLARGLTSR